MKYERKLDSALKEGNIEEISHTLNLIVSESKKNGKEEDADEYGVLKLILEAISALGPQRSWNGQRSTMKKLQKAKRILGKYPSDPEARDIIALVESLLLIAKAQCKLWKNDVDCAMNLLEESVKELQVLKEKLPDFAEMAELLRLQMLSDLYLVKAMKAFEQGDMTRANVFIGEATQSYHLLYERSDQPESRLFFKAQINQAQALFKLMEAMETVREELRCPECGSILNIGLLTNATESDQVERLKRSLKESQNLLRESLADLRVLDSNQLPKAKHHLLFNEGLRSVVAGIRTYAEAYQSLLSGRQFNAKTKFKIALEKFEDTIQIFAKAGEIMTDCPIMSFINSLRDSSTKWIRSIERENRQLRRRFALSASKQFGAFFVLFLLFFVAVDYYNLLATTSYIKIQVALCVSAIAAFGANAAKLKDLLNMVF